MQIRSAYDGSRVQVLTGGGDSMTRESFADELNINTIVDRYARGGQIPLTTADAMYGDVSEVGDYKSALDFVFAAKGQMADLPERARDQLAADPMEYYNLLDAAKNRSDLVDLGLLEKLPEPEPDPAPAVPAPDPPAAAGEGSG